eukprot:m.36713 g.36713  ORF g.36713 m.36713 type:complete len:50 (-) comp11306_c0_seq1:29-178(-)
MNIYFSALVAAVFTRCQTHGLLFFSRCWCFDVVHINFDFILFFALILSF